MYKKQKRCPKGHFYDDSHAVCPICQALGLTEKDTDRSINLPTLDESTDEDNNITRPLWKVEEKENEGKTLSDSIVAWIFCTQGKECGRGFPIYAHNNYIGHGNDQDIQLADPTISSRHFVIAFNPEENDFFAYMQNDAHSAVWINGKSLLKEIIHLKLGDKIKLGDTELIFISLK